MRSRCAQLLLAFGVLGVSAQAATLQGTVVDPRKTPVANALAVIQLNNSQATEKIVHTDAKGHYQLSSLHAGEYSIRVGETSFGPYALKEDESKTVDLILTSTTASIDFIDEPKFTVAGLTDHTYVGGHGSDAVKQSAEELTKATAALSQDQRPAAAVEHLQKASRLDPNNADLHRLLAAAEETLGNPLKAVHEYEQAAKLDPSETNLFDWGTELLIHQALDPALDVFGQGIRLFPSSSRMLLGAGTAFYARGEYTQAAKSFFAATDVHPEDPAPYLFLGKLRDSEITQSAGYLQRMTRFAQLQPQNAFANYYYALALWMQRNDSNDIQTSRQSQALLETAVRLDPTLALAHLQLGILFAAKQDFPAAIRSYRKAIELNPQMEQAHYRLAQVYRETGQTERAQAENALFQKLSNSSARQLARERSELQRFVVALKAPASNQ